MPAIRGAGASELEGKERKLFVGEEGRGFLQVFGPGQCKHFQPFSLLQFLELCLFPAGRSWSTWMMLEVKRGVHNTP